MPENGRKEHRRTKYGQGNPLVPVAGDRVRALLRALDLSNREAARRVAVHAQTLDNITSEPQHQRQARRSLIDALGRLPEEQDLPRVPGAWLTGEAKALIQGSERPPGYELELYWLTMEFTGMMRGLLHLRGAAHGRGMAALAGITSPEAWRAWLLPGAPGLSAGDAERTARHLAQAFRVILAPLRVGKSRLNRRAMRALAVLGASQVITS